MRLLWILVSEDAQINQEWISRAKVLRILYSLYIFFCKEILKNRWYMRTKQSEFFWCMCGHPLCCNWSLQLFTIVCGRLSLIYTITLIPELYVVAFARIQDIPFPIQHSCEMQINVHSYCYKLPRRDYMVYNVVYDCTKTNIIYAIHNLTARAGLISYNSKFNLNVLNMPCLFIFIIWELL